MRTKRVALATAEMLPDLHPDDALLIPALAERGCDARAVIWSDESVDWSAFDAVVIRSCWDYHLRIAEFIDWIERAATATRLLNDRPIVEWNLHKSYLIALAERGFRIPKTRIERDIVVKPTISASGYRTYFFDEVLVQEFVPEIAAGEWSLIFLEGSFSHSVSKHAAPGEFRVHEEHGGEIVPGIPPAAVLEFARRVILEVTPAPLYARVDVVERPAGPTLMELELIEPLLYLGTADGAVERMASAIVRRLGRQ